MILKNAWTMFGHWLRTGEWNYSIYKEGLMYVGAIAELEQCIANASTGEWVCETEKEIEQIAGKDNEIRIYEKKIHHIVD